MNKKNFLNWLFIIGLIVQSFNSYAQVKPTTTITPNVGTGGGSGALPPPDIDRSLIPQSPDATAFLKYGDVPLNLARGEANLSIPLFNTKIGKIPLDVTLSYAYTGLRPTEIPSWVGLGWTLNVGGSITRSVRGLIDGYRPVGLVAYGLFDNIPDPSWFSDNQLFLNETYSNARDAEPDMYNYSFAGHSGRFILKNGKAVTIPFDNINISYNGTNFTIISEDGTSYFFGNTETAWAKLIQGSTSPQTYVTGWRLTSITSSDKVDMINFGYKSISYRDLSTTYGQQVTYTDLGNGVVNPTADLHTSNGDTRLDVLQLTSLATSALSIKFDLDTNNIRQEIMASGTYYPLKDIMVTGGGGNLVKQIFFTYNYFPGSGPMLKLQQVKQTGLASLDTLRYQFNYENETSAFPNYGTNGLDIYGYYNGKDGNGNLAFSTPTGYIPANGSTGSTGGNDRTPNLSYCKYGALNKITYPTGGYTTLNYELNPGPGIRVRRYVSFDPINNRSVTKVLAYTLSNGLTSSIQFLGGAQVYQPFNHYDVQACGGNGVPSTPEYHNYVANLNNVVGFDYNHNEIQPFFYSQVSEMDSASEIHLTVHNFNANGGGVTDVYQTGRTVYKQSGTGYIPVQTASFNYTLPTVLADTSLSGVPTKVDIVYCSQAPLPPTNSDPNTRQQQLRGETYTLYSFLRTLNNETTTTYGDNGVNQTVQHLYFYDNPVHRQLTREVVINSTGDSLFTQYSYPFDYPSPCSPTTADSIFKVGLQSLYNNYQSCKSQRLNCTAGATSCYNSFPCEVNAYQGFANLVSTWNTNKGNYSTCLSNAISAQSDLNIRALYLMQSNHYLNTLVEKFVYKKKAGNPNYILLDAIKTEFTISYLGVAIPKAIWAAEIPANLTLTQFLANKATYYTRRVNMVYDNNSKLVQQNKETGVNDCYLWGYNHQYPVAEVKGSDYNTIVSMVNMSVLDNPTSDDAMRTELNKIRTGLAATAAQVTTFTYSSQVGMTSSTDANGRITYFQYDPLGRLKAVLDKDGNIVKTMDYHYMVQ